MQLGESAGKEPDRVGSTLRLVRPLPVETGISVRATLPALQTSVSPLQHFCPDRSWNFLDRMHDRSAGTEPCPITFFHVSVIVHTHLLCFDTIVGVALCVVVLYLQFWA